MDDLLFSSWQPWKASGIIQSKCEGLRTREADDVNFSPRAGEDKAKMFQLKEWSRKMRQISSFSTLGSTQVLDGSDNAHTHRGQQAITSSLLCQRLTSFRSILIGTLRNNV